MTQVLVQDGLLSTAEFRLSPNHDQRPADTEISLIVVHCISLPPGQFGGEWIDSLFMNRIRGDEHQSFADLKGLEVSSHLLIRRDGRIVQYVPFHLRAWHAGVSSFAGVDRCNDYSIGIELEGADEIAYEPVQYQVLAEAVRALMTAYPRITPQRIVGHSDIAPGRKTDPGPAFDWALFRRYLDESR